MSPSSVRIQSMSSRCGSGSGGGSFSASSHAAIHFLDALVFFLGLLRRQLAQNQPISFAIFSSASSESPYFSISSRYLSVRASDSFKNFS